MAGRFGIGEDMETTTPDITAKLNGVKSRLHSLAMNARCEKRESTADTYGNGYLHGHRDARHAIAEAVLSDEVWKDILAEFERVDAAVIRLEAIMRARRSSFLRSVNVPTWYAHIDEAIAELRAALKEPQ